MNSKNKKGEMRVTREYEREEKDEHHDVVVDDEDIFYV